MLYFDGVDDFLHIPEESEGNGYLRLFHTMTISAWVLRKPGGNATQNLLSKFDKNAAEGFDQKLYVQLNNSYLKFAFVEKSEMGDQIWEIETDAGSDIELADDEWFLASVVL